MSEQVPASPGADGSTPVPRDPPDQQADGGQDPWDLQFDENRPQNQNQGKGKDEDEGQEPAPNQGQGQGQGQGEDVPDTDEAGTGRRGSSPAAQDPSGSPEPEEPSG
ncbi:hypothetical protein ACH4D5_34710 [Streptomyces sp. NPDC018029]|uniref:hypothetical protein n=1 Tax=Streptomyces sp. NPDC018029 TaxID=3365032 RepID=UPI0037AFBE67